MTTFSQMTGSSAKRTAFSDSHMPDSASLQPAPCRKSPWTFTPLSGGGAAGAAPLPPAGLPRSAVGSEKNASWSMGIFVLRACTCLEQVMKPWGKKKQGSQKLGGGPCTSQSCMKATRASKSANQELRGFRHGYEIGSPQRGGSFCTRKQPYISSSSADITTRPLMALPRLTRVLFTLAIRALKRSSSCPWKTPWETMPPLAVLAYVSGCASLRCRSSGARAKKPSAISATSSSGLFPTPPEDALGCTLTTVSRNLLASSDCAVICALECRPNTCGSSSSGKLATNLRTSSTDPSGGAV
mmetsp:Transcript_81723/g.213186  ORF Transcript_81723/g.213186 Transcript_81723/m.213186 type:complete len:299 (-) Transcript_81723:1075-1971(-)